ncbi:hypothetical protein [Sebaldella sp. S0638]|uniref:hypothetical protein n=1 Tax=Sebaldella sp. S0638 TaxID=2957809 RepID=UPI00209E16E8|nr:hypothetical protein [Sebaldella sp. S0638]MCP1223745.1 hypothetical protein [Sebaldella sp. S0638]
MKNKKLMMLLAMSSMANIYAGTETELKTGKYERLYNNMTKNMNKGLSNDSNYKLIEKVLNQRNKELKDLYMQCNGQAKWEH